MQKRNAEKQGKRSAGASSLLLLFEHAQLEPELPLLCQTFFLLPCFRRLTPVRRGTFFGSPVAAFLISPPSSSAISARVRRVRIEAGAISVTSSSVV